MLYQAQMEVVGKAEKKKKGRQRGEEKKGREIGKEEEWRAR